MCADMKNLFQILEDTAARGAEGLLPEARARVALSLRELQCPDGGFKGLDGRSDPYFSFFAWLSLRALGAAYDRDPLCAYMAAHRHDANRVDARCSQFLLAVEGQGARVTWLALAVAFLRSDEREVYGAFLLMLVNAHVPRWLAKLAWRRQHRLFETAAAERLPTPRLAAGLLLAHLSGQQGASVSLALEARRCVAGGFVSVPGAWPDLLATAVARFALWNGRLARAPQGREVKANKGDLMFIEDCWLKDGLFGASPAADRGDAEHTFYGLLALGTCR